MLRLGNRENLMTINEHILKISGKATLPKELSLGHNYKITTDGEITTITDSTNQDGTLDKIYKFEPILCEILGDNGESIKAKDTRKRSQQLRSVIVRNWRESNSALEQDDFYDREMLGLIKRYIDEH